MDESLQELENELKALRPRRPSVLLRARLEKELAPGAPMATPAAAQSSVDRMAPRYSTASTVRSWKWAGWQLAAAAAVALVVSLGVWRWQSGAQPEAPETAPAFAQAPRNEMPVERTEPVATSPSTDSRQLAVAAPRDSYRPVKAANVLYDLQDEGLVLLNDNVPARRVRARYVDTYTWKNPATNASLKWSVPRDEVRVLPTTFH